MLLWLECQSVSQFSHSVVWLTPWIAAHQASLSITNSQSLPKLMSIESVMPSSHLNLCRPLLLLLPPIPPRNVGCIYSYRSYFILQDDNACLNLSLHLQGLKSLPVPSAVPVIPSYHPPGMSSAPFSWQGNLEQNKECRVPSAFPILLNLPCPSPPTTS